MRKLVLGLIALLLTGTAIFFACKSMQMDEKPIVNTQGQEKEVLNSNKANNSETCCTVRCRKGSCSATKSPCSCTCLRGQPMCGTAAPSTVSNFDRVIYLENEEQLASYDNLANYLTQLSAHNVANSIKKTKQLFIENNWVLSTPATLTAYDNYMKVFFEFYKRQSEDIQNKIEEL
jgi:hypothetical protein